MNFDVLIKILLVRGDEFTRDDHQHEHVPVEKILFRENLILKLKSTSYF